MPSTDLLLHLHPEGAEHYRTELRPASKDGPLVPEVVSVPDWERFHWRLNPLRRGRIEAGPLREIGQLLADIAFPPLVRAAFRSELEKARPSMPLYLRLLIHPPELEGLPWECLYLDPAGFLALHPNLRLVRQTTLESSLLQPSAGDQLHVLLATPNPVLRGWPPLQGLDRHVAAAKAAFAQVGAVTVTELPQATPDALASHLQTQLFHVLHFYGHGRYDDQRGGALILEESPPGSGQPQALEARTLMNLLAGPPVRTVLLMACATDPAAPERETLGLAQALSEAGVPAVVGTQGEWPEDSAGLFIREFYREFAAGHPLDACVAAGRHALRNQTPDWGLPVLYLSTLETHLFVPQNFDLGDVHGAPFLVGRESEANEVGQALQPGRVVCLTGAGGMGKTALAVEAAHRQRWRFPGGVFGLALETLPSLERVQQRLGRWLLGERWDTIPADEREAQLATTLHERSVLLLLDNYETVTRERAQGSPAGVALESFFHRCLSERSQSVLLVTSREPTGLPGEQPFPVPDLDPAAAVDLFRQRATRRSESREALDCLIKTLGGHPLALALIASAYNEGWASLDEIRAQVEINLWSAVDPTRPDRQKTLAACFDYSLKALPDVPARFFLSLGVFAGPFTAEAASAVSGQDHLEGLLEYLYNRSLLCCRSLPRSDGPMTLYSLHPAVRLYVRERIKNEDQTACRAAMVDHYAALTAKAQERWGKEAGWTALLRAVWPDLEQAQAWAEGKAAADLAYRLGWLATEFGELDTAVALYERVLTVPPTSPDLAAKAHRSLGGIAHQRGQWEAAEAHYQEAGQAFAKAHDLRGQATVRHEQARLRADQGDFAAAERLYSEALTLFQRASDPYGEARTRYSRAVLDRLRGEFARAGQDCEAVLATFQEMGERRMMAAVQHELGYLAFVRGDYDQARARYEASLALNRELGTRIGIAVTQHNLGELHAEEGNLATARRMQEEAAAIFTEMGHRQGQAETSRELGRLDRLAGDLASAERRCQEALIWQTQIGDHRGQAATLLELAALRQAQGRLDEALSLANESQSLAEQAEDRLGQAHAPLLRAEVLAAKDDLPGALAAAWESWQRYTALGAAGAERARRLLQDLRTRLGAAFAEAWQKAAAAAARPVWLRGESHETPRKINT